jgi:spermidine synthase
VDRSFLLVCILFLLSGASGLIYQVLWVRMLSLVFGVTVYAVSTVLATFMGGLALGSALGGRLADRVRRPLAWFGAAELLVGLTAVLTPLLLRFVELVYVGAATTSRSAFALTVFRFVGAAAVLAVASSSSAASACAARLRSRPR